MAALDGVRIGNPLFVESISLAVTEAVGNAVLYAYPAETGEIEVTVFRNDLGVTVIIVDHGVGFEPAAAPHGLGLGLKLIDQLSTTSTVDSDSNGTTVTMHFGTPCSAESTGR